MAVIASHLSCLRYDAHGLIRFGTARRFYESNLAVPYRARSSRRKVQLNRAVSNQVENGFYKVEPCRTNNSLGSARHGSTYWRSFMQIRGPFHEPFLHVPFISL